MLSVIIVVLGIVIILVPLLATQYLSEIVENAIDKDLEETSKQDSKFSKIEINDLSGE